MAKSKFSISEGMLNSISKNIDKSNLIDAKENFKFDYIDIDKLKVNNKNFYPIIDIETLAEDISINGLNHNLVIRPIEDGFYEIISGERRYSALKSLVDKGDNKYSKVPCKIVNLNDVDSEITLIQANAQTRELSDADKLKQIERLTELYKEKKKNGEKVTNIRKLVSKDIGLSEGQVAKYSTVSNNLIPELRTILDEDVQADIRLINSYDDDEIGSLITTNFICIKDNLTIRQAMHELVQQAGENDNIATIYVVDEEDRFCGANDLKD